MAGRKKEIKTDDRNRDSKFEIRKKERIVETEKEKSLKR